MLTILFGKLNIFTHESVECQTKKKCPQFHDIATGIIANGSGLGSSTVDQVLKYTKYPKYIPSTSTGQVHIFLKST